MGFHKAAGLVKSTAVLPSEILLVGLLSHEFLILYHRQRQIMRIRGWVTVIFATMKYRMVLALSVVYCPIDHTMQSL